MLEGLYEMSRRVDMEMAVRTYGEPIPQVVVKPVVYDGDTLLPAFIAGHGGNYKQMKDILELNRIGTVFGPNADLQPGIVFYVPDHSQGFSVHPEA